MNPKSLICLSGLLMPAAGSGLFSDSMAQQTERPNIIFILTDDQRWDALGYAGNDIIHTPEMDKLAEQGAYFSHAFVTTPICAASRASILTGMYERTHMMTFGTPPLEKEYVDISYPRLMKEAGYYSGFIGKFGMWLENKLDTTLFDYYDTHGIEFYYRLVGPGWSKHRHLTDLMGDRSLEFLDNVPENRPFCLSLSFNAPHAEDQSPEQYIWPPDMDSLYQDVTIPAKLFSEPEYFESQPDFVKEGLNRVRWHWRYDTPEKYQRMVKGYYRMISGVDRVIGRIRKALEEHGMADNTVIMLMGDNGYFLGERGFAGKWLMYEHALRVPLIIYQPGKKPVQNTFEDMALNIDIAPTILDLAGIQVPGVMQGKSLLPLLNGKTDHLRDHFLCEHLYDLQYIPQSEGIRTKTWKYFRYRQHPGHEELYNLQSDPREAENLASKDKYQDVLEKYRNMCNETIKELEKERLNGN